MAVCHNYADVAVIHTLSGVDLLNGVISNIGGIALALDSVPDAALFGKNINALVTAGLRDLDAGEGKAEKKPSAPMLKVISAHRINRAEDFTGSRWNRDYRRGAWRRRLRAVLFRFGRGGFGHGRGLDNACMYQGADEHKHDDREQQRTEEVKPGGAYFIREKEIAKQEVQDNKDEVDDDH